jgi:hypothetical protein
MKASLAGIEGRKVHGSGICVDQSCSVVATAAHVQMLAGRANLAVDNARTRKILSAAAPEDANQSKVQVGSETKVWSYNLGNDVAFVYTTKPVPRKSGVTYSYNPSVGDKVTVAGYRDRVFETKEARIIGWNVPLAVGQGQLDENLILDTELSPGTSGSGVFDERGRLLGMIVLSGVLQFKSGDLSASVALPMKTLARALTRVDPALGSALFDPFPEGDAKGETTTKAEYVVYRENDVPDPASLVIPELSAVPIEVSHPVEKLRAQAEAASRQMVNFVTTQCLAQGSEKPICHELSIADGQQTFRRKNKNGRLGKPTRAFPVQKHGVWTDTDWADSLAEIAENPWIFEGMMGEHYLFSYLSDADDDRCYYEEYSQGSPLFGGGHPGWKGSVVCREQIITDKDFNVLATFSEQRPPESCLTRLIQTAMYYEWVKVEGLNGPILLPVKARVAARVLGQKDPWYTSIDWSDYKKFRAEHDIKY